MGLLLHAAGLGEPPCLRWTLSDAATGVLVAGHTVNPADRPDEIRRFAGLYGHVSWYAAPDRRVPDGARLVAEAGEWAGRVLLGAELTTLRHQ